MSATSGCGLTLEQRTTYPALAAIEDGAIALDACRALGHDPTTLEADVRALVEAARDAWRCAAITGGNTVRRPLIAALEAALAPFAERKEADDA